MCVRELGEWGVCMCEVERMGTVCEREREWGVCVRKS